LNEDYETVKLNYMQEKELHKHQKQVHQKEKKAITTQVQETKSNLKETTESWFRMREKSSEKNKEYKNRMNYLKQQEGQL